MFTLIPDVKSNLTYQNATEAYRVQKLKDAEGGWLDSRIPFQLFITICPLSIYRTIGRTTTMVSEMMTAAQIRYSCTMRYAVGFEPFDASRDIHCHVALASAAQLDIGWFESYLSKRSVDPKVLPYAKRHASYTVKYQDVELRNCDVYLKPELNTRQLRRQMKRYQLELERMKCRHSIEKEER